MSEAKGLINKAEKLVAEINKSKKTVDDVPAPAKQQELLALSTQISALIAKMVAGDEEIGKLKEKYLLEGQVGTYATIPKPVGDKLTPDHQPQASVILAGADFFQESLGIEGGELAARAANRAAQGYAINLHFKRHVAGATYGSKGETRQGFKAKLVSAAGKLKVNAAKAKVVEMLRSALKKDVDQMKTVAAGKITDEAWKQLKEEIPTEKKAIALKEEIANRVVKGENQVASQPFDF